jgi:hypothetical protein
LIALTRFGRPIWTNDKCKQNFQHAGAVTKSGASL